MSATCVERDATTRSHSGTAAQSSSQARCSASTFECPAAAAFASSWSSIVRLKSSPYTRSSRSASRSPMVPGPQPTSSSVVAPSRSMRATNSSP